MPAPEAAPRISSVHPRVVSAAAPPPAPTPAPRPVKVSDLAFKLTGVYENDLTTWRNVNGAKGRDPRP